MDYAKLKDEIAEISTIAASVPDEFRSKCFEILLTRLLDGDDGTTSHKRRERKDTASGTEGASSEGASSKQDTERTGHQPLPIHAQVRVWMQRTGITTDELNAVLMFDDGDVHFIKEPHGVKVAVGQLQWALLLALRNGILNNSLSVDAEAVRSICQDKGFYDAPNFAANFKRTSGTKLFKEPLEPQGEAQSLSNDGQAELAKLIRTLAGTAKS